MARTPKAARNGIDAAEQYKPHPIITGMKTVIDELDAICDQILTVEGIPNGVVLKLGIMRGQASSLREAFMAVLPTVPASGLDIVVTDPVAPSTSEEREARF
jgi:hypothetical protein